LSTCETCEQIVFNRDLTLKTHNCLLTLKEALVLKSGTIERLLEENKSLKNRLSTYENDRAIAFNLEGSDDHDQHGSHSFNVAISSRNPFSIDQSQQPSIHNTNDDNILIRECFSGHDLKMGKAGDIVNR